MSEASSHNPYAVTTDVINAQLVDDSDAAAIRKKYLSHEASIKSIGILYWLGGVLGCLAGIAYLVSGFSMFADAKLRDTAIVMIIIGPLLAGFSIFQIVLAQALRKLRPWARIGTIVLSIIGLLGFPIGTILSLYFLYLVASPKGGYVFSPAYQQVIAATPHMRYKTSIASWILLGLLVLLLVGLVIAAMLGSSR